MIKGFRDFLLRGNVVDLGVAVIPIPGAKSGAQAAANAATLSFQLTGAEVEALSTATRAWRQ